MQTADMAAFLKTYNWDYFLTVTPKHTRTDPLAFMRDVWQEIGPKGPAPAGLVSKNGVTRDATRSFLACEPFFLGHNLHVHGLVAGTSDIYLPWWLQQGLDFHLGRSRLQLCKSQAQVSDYCSKYVSKFMGGDNYDFFGDWT